MSDTEGEWSFGDGSQGNHIATGLDVLADGAPSSSDGDWSLSDSENGIDSEAVGSQGRAACGSHVFCLDHPVARRNPGGRPRRQHVAASASTDVVAMCNANAFVGVHNAVSATLPRPSDPFTHSDQTHAKGIA